MTKVVQITSRLRFGRAIDHAKDPAVGNRQNSNADASLVAFKGHNAGEKKVSTALDVYPREELNRFDEGRATENQHDFSFGTPWSKQ